MNLLKSIRLIINYKTFIVTALAIIATVICHYFNYMADLPLTLIGIAIVFPIVFAINSAYDRREYALKYLADFKSHGIAVAYAARDWGTDHDHKAPAELKENLKKLFYALRQKLLSPKEIINDYDQQVYSQFSYLSKNLQNFKDYNISPVELATVNQYLSRMMVDYENMKIVYNYRTPITLRAYSKVFLHIFPIIYAPYFALLAHEFPNGFAYILPVLFSFVLVSLDNIQVHLENPFDQIGEDDIRLDVEDYVQLIGH